MKRQSAEALAVHLREIKLKDGTVQIEQKGNKFTLSCISFSFFFSFSRRHLSERKKKK